MGKDIHNVPFDIEVKARADFKPQEWLRQVVKRSQGKELSAVVVRMNNMGEDVSQYLAFMRFDDLVQLLLRAGYGDIQKDSVELEPERCAKCGSWKLKEVPCRTCANADL
jgi:phage terminase large subunit-like protein